MSAACGEGGVLLLTHAAEGVGLLSGEGGVLLLVHVAEGVGVLSVRGGVVGEGVGRGPDFGGSVLVEVSMSIRMRFTTFKAPITRDKFCGSAW